MILNDLRLIYHDLNVSYNIDIGYNIGYNLGYNIDIDIGYHMGYNTGYNIDIDTGRLYQALRSAQARASPFAPSLSARPFSQASLRASGIFRKGLCVCCLTHSRA